MDFVKLFYYKNTAVKMFNYNKYNPTTTHKT